MPFKQNARTPGTPGSGLSMVRTWRPGAFLIRRTLQRREERQQIALLRRAECVERSSGSRALAVVGGDGGGAIAGAAVVQQEVAEAQTPERRGPHAARDRHGVAGVADAIAQGPHVVDQEVRIGSE